jgi:hypothetical protein
MGTILIFFAPTTIFPQGFAFAVKGEINQNNVENAILVRVS